MVGTHFKDWYYGDTLVLADGMVIELDSSNLSVSLLSTAQEVSLSPAVNVSIADSSMEVRLASTKYSVLLTEC